jgi:hypothetical protein
VDLGTGRLSHDDCPTAERHIENARKAARPGERYVLTKPSQMEKIDASMSSALAHEATADAIAAGWTGEAPKRRRVVVGRG